MIKRIGLRNTVTDGEQWKYLLFYDKDNPVDLGLLQETLKGCQSSYVMYSTKNGLHLVGLTPLNGYEWACEFETLQTVQKEYYSGSTIRLSRKHGENQKLISYNLDYPVMSNLYSIYMKRFESLPGTLSNEISNYRLVFEKYWSRKE